MGDKYKLPKSEIYIKQMRLPFGDYVKCDICKEWWTIYISFRLFGHEFVMCPDCYERFKKEVNKVK